YASRSRNLATFSQIARTYGLERRWVCITGSHAGGHHQITRRLRTAGEARPGGAMHARMPPGLCKFLPPRSHLTEGFHNVSTRSVSNRLATVSPANLGLLLGLLGVLAFSFTLPLTRIAAPVLGGAFTGMGRAFVAALLASALLL